MKKLTTTFAIYCVMTMTLAPTTVLAGPTTILTTTLESVQIEPLFNPNHNDGLLNVSELNCPSCPTQTLILNKSVKLFFEGKARPFNELSAWKNVRADVRYDEDTNVVVSISRH